MADLENLRQLVKNLENYGAQVKEHVEAFESLQDRLATPRTMPRTGWRRSARRSRRSRTSSTARRTTPSAR